MSPRRVVLLAICVLVLLAAGSAAILHLHRPLPAPAMVGTAACASCHQQAFADWQQSHHRHAMELPGPDSVLGDFADARFEYFGTTSRFFTRDGQYFVETDNAQGKLETFRVAYTFGWFPLQQYLVEFPDGRMQALGISWDSRPAAQGGQRWYHLYPDEHVTHEDPLHWTGAFQNWNSRCAACHSTALVKGYSQQQNRYQTSWRELNVGCEACHGPGSQHVAWAEGRKSLPHKGLQLNLDAVWQPPASERPIAPAAAPMSTQLQVCSGCHSRRTELQQPDVLAGFADNYLLSPLAQGLYHPDGQILEEVFETGSFLQSRMHQNQVSCSNCHEPHGGRLRAEGNGLCLQCHEPQKFQREEHFFHEPQSTGAQCVNCHMPQQTYMGVDARRDHSFRVPDPAASVQSGVPNACTQCHRDRDDRWAADFLARRSGRVEPWYTHTALIAAARRHDAAAIPGLLAYANAPANPPMLRAMALQESARFPSQQQLQAVSRELASADPLLRAGAAQAVGYLDPSQRLQLLRPLLEDPVRSVRMAVARQLADQRLADAPAEARAPLGRLFDEYRQALLHNADMPESMSDLGVFLLAQGDAQGAEQALLHARALAPRFLPATLNLSDIYRARDRDDLGEPLLREAMQQYPQSGDARHMLGLLYVRTGRTPASVELFRQASQLSPDNPQYALVYAVSLAETGNMPAAIRVLETATTRFPGHGPLRQALEGYRSRQP
jgi:predicted CXXCH cytochrome family protein